MSKTSIEWTDMVWNPTRGCSRVSEGCRNCFAERIAARFSRNPEDAFNGFAIMTPSGPRWTGKVELIEDKLTEPLRWHKPRRVFVNSMSDLFHENLAPRYIDRVFAVMSQSPQHVFQVLTKRSWQMREYMQSDRTRDGIDEAGELFGWCHSNVVGRWPTPNVWLGVSVEDRAHKTRIDDLRETPAAVRFLSVEPLLEDIGELDLRGIDWVIVGGESGPGARTCRIEWIRSIVKQCRDAEVACFVKQFGSNPEEEVTAPRDGHRWNRRVVLKNRKGGDLNEWPQDLRVREFPEVSR